MAHLKLPSQLTLAALAFASIPGCSGTVGDLMGGPAEGEPTGGAGLAGTGGSDSPTGGATNGSAGGATNGSTGGAANGSTGGGSADGGLSGTGADGNTPSGGGTNSNHAPAFSSLLTERSVFWGNSINLTAEVEDADGDEISISWTATSGAITGSGFDVTYEAPTSGSTDLVLVTITDTQGASTEEAITISLGGPMDFSDPTIIEATSGNSKCPTIAIMEDGTIHVAWHDFTTDPASLYYAEGTGVQWNVENLAITTNKAIRPVLLREASTLHLFWEDYPGATGVLSHSVLNGSSWTTPEEIASGTLISPVIAPSGDLHAVFFLSTGVPGHAIYQGGSWSSGDPITITDDYINALSIHAEPTANGIQFALATSPGNTGYDINLLQWTESGGWGSAKKLYSSYGLSSDDVSGATDSTGTTHWVWTEQDSSDANMIGVVEKTNNESDYRNVSSGTGFSMAPEIVFPPDDKAIVAWESPNKTIGVSRYPYSSQIELGQYAHWPELAVDAEGFTHLVFTAKDDSNIEQIYYSTNRP